MFRRSRQISSYSSSSNRRVWQIIYLTAVRSSPEVLAEKLPAIHDRASLNPETTYRKLIGACTLTAAHHKPGRPSHRISAPTAGYKATPSYAQRPRVASESSAAEKLPEVKSLDVFWS